MQTDGQVVALALSTEGRRALSGGFGKQVQLWDVDSGVELKRIPLDRAVISLAFAPDGRRGLAGLDDGTLRLIDLDAGQEILRLQGQTMRTVRTVAVSPDGRRALSGSDDQTVRLWDLQTGRELRRLGEHRATIWSVAFAPDGRRALAGGDDGVLFVWDTSDWRVVHRLEGAWDAVRSAAFAPDGRRALSGHGSGKLILWDLESGQEAFRLLGSGGRLALAVLPDGHRVLTADSDGLVRLWSLQEDLVRPRELDLLGHWEKAGAELDKSLRSRPDDPRLWTLRGRHHMLLGNWDQATTDYRKAIELGRDDPWVLAVIADALRVELPSSGDGARHLLDLLDPDWPRSVALWTKLGRPVLGIDVEPLQDGCRLKSIDPAGGAGKAGFQVGDVLMEVGGKAVVDSDSIRLALKRHHPGDKVVVTFRRGTNSGSSTVTLGYRPTPFLVRLDQSRPTLDTNHRRFLDAGYRPVHVATYARAARKREPHYAGLWIKDGISFLSQVESSADTFHKQCRELPAGYRPTWLSVSGDADSRRWSAIWVEEPDRLPWQQHEDLSRSALEAMIQERAAQGYRPTLLTAYRDTGDETRYAGVWIKDGRPYLARVHITAGALQQELASLSAGWRPEWVDVYKEQGRRHFTAIFIKDEAQVDWRLTVDTPEWGMQTIVKKLSQEGFTPLIQDLE
jgi:WD40 repeat protein